MIAYSVLGKREDWWRYLRARAIRIFVPLVPVLALSYFLVFVRTDGAAAPDFAGLLGNLLMLQDLTALSGTVVAPYMGNNPLWSLSYEWWFYIAFIPIMCVPGWTLRTSIVTCVGVLAAVAYPFYPHWTLRVLFHFAIWWTGVLLAKSWLEGSPRVQSLVPLVVVSTTLVAVVVLTWQGFAGFGGTPFLELRHMLAGVALASGAFVWRHFRWIGFDLLVGWFALVAPISYGLYIVHRPILTFAKDLAGNWSIVPAIALSFFAAWLVEAVFYRWVARNLAPRPKPES